MVLQPPAVGDARQGVVVREVLELVLELLAGLDLAVKPGLSAPATLDQPGDGGAGCVRANPVKTNRVTGEYRRLGLEFRSATP